MTKKAWKKKRKIVLAEKAEKTTKIILKIINYTKHWPMFSFSSVIADRYINDEQPWVLNKNKDENWMLS